MHNYFNNYLFLASQLTSSVWIVDLTMAI